MAGDSQDLPEGRVPDHYAIYNLYARRQTQPQRPDQIRHDTSFSIHFYKQNRTETPTGRGERAESVE